MTKKINYVETAAKIKNKKKYQKHLFMIKLNVFKEWRLLELGCL